MGTLWYSNLLAGIVRGAFEQVRAEWALGLWQLLAQGGGAENSFTLAIDVLAVTFSTLVVNCPLPLCMVPPPGADARQGRLHQGRAARGPADGARLRVGLKFFVVAAVRSHPLCYVPSLFFCLRTNYSVLGRSTQKVA